MSTRYYRLTVIACALTWFLAGLHWPIVHQITEHGRSPAWPILMIVVFLFAAAAASLWMLLRASSQRAP